MGYLFRGGLEDDVRSIGSAIDDAITQPILNTVEAVLDDPKKLALIAISVLAPGIGTAIGSSIGLTGATATFVGNAVVNTALNGGDVKAGLLSAAIPVVGKEVANLATSAFVDAGMDTALATTVGNVTSRGLITAARGGDAVDVLLRSGLTAGTDAVLREIPGFDTLDSNVQNITTRAVVNTLAGNKTLSANDLVNTAINVGRRTANSFAGGDYDSEYIENYFAPGGAGYIASADTDTTGLDTGDVITSVGNITDTTGLDTGDVITSLDGTTGVDTEDVTSDDTGDDDIGLLTVCGPGMFFNTATGVCEENPNTVVIKDKAESCLPGTVLNPVTGDCELIDDKGEVTITAKKDTCLPGTKLNPETGDCDPDWDEGGGEVCGVGEHLDPATGMCVPDVEIDDTTECAPGFHLENGLCVADDDTDTNTDCPEGYVRNLATGTCEKVTVTPPPPPPPPPPPKPCPTGYQRVNGVCVPIKTVVPDLPTGFLPSTSAFGAGEKTDPIYAGAMDDFNLFATLEELLANNPDKKSKDKTKMATGGYLDDLLAEQMTVDDLLKLLR